MRGLAIRLLAIPVLLSLAFYFLLAGLAALSAAIAAEVSHVLAFLRTLFMVLSLLGILVTVVVICWRRSFPHRATKVMAQLMSSGDKGRDRPRLRRAWRQGSVWTLAWKMPFGLTTAKLLKERQAIEERLNCSAEFWYEGGRIWMRAGIARLPENVRYVDFYREGRPKGELVFGVGRGRTGQIWADLAELPHLLVGGLTGRGKSVFLRQLLVSLIEHCSPERLRLVLFDFKGGVEFRVFGLLGHLWVPIVTDTEDAEIAIGRLNTELTRRQAALEQAGVENVKRWNAQQPDHPWARLVVVVDEMAELSAAEAASKEERERRQRIHAGLSRLCRLGRASGLHVIAATQRPDKDAVPGQIKANIPATVAFFVRARVNSEILLGETNYGAAALPPWPGRGIYQMDGETHVQVPLLNVDEAETRLAVLRPKKETPVEPETGLEAEAA
jgi:hypothetical protein